jgi:protein-tyrosine phosphatase
MMLDTYRIRENLYQGAFPPHGNAVADAGFNVLVLCAWENQDPSNYPGVEVVCAPGDDINQWPVDPQELSNWQNASSVVVERLKAGKKVLVTCIGGYNRSGMVTAMTLHAMTGWSGEDIVSFVSSRRPGALFNRSFARWCRENLEEETFDE